MIIIALWAVFLAGFVAGCWWSGGRRQPPMPPSRVVFRRPAGVLNSMARLS